jgi:hypothetical protein
MATQNYIDILRALHEHLQPHSYLEVGTQKGQSLELARCRSIAVDPKFAISGNVISEKPSCMFFQMKSDIFFEHNDPVALLGGKIDLIFLDGMHLFEYLLRDFSNAERQARPNSIIAIHDVLPTNARMAERNPSLGEAWTGDVWKAILALKKHRPDLRVLVIDAAPTGLALCTNLNPESTILVTRYFEIVEEYRSLSLDEVTLAGYRDSVSVQPCDILGTPEKIATWFWL